MMTYADSRVPGGFASSSSSVPSRAPLSKRARQKGKGAHREGATERETEAATYHSESATHAREEREGKRER